MNIELLKKYATDFLMSKARADKLPVGSDAYTRALVRADIFADYMADEILNTGSFKDIDEAVKTFLSSINCTNILLFDRSTSALDSVIGYSINGDSLQIEKAPF